MSTASKKRKPGKAPHKEYVDRWCPPKPLVGLPLIEKVLNRHTAVTCSESLLIVAVLARAIHDCLSPTSRYERRKARDFIPGPSLEGWCDLVGLQPDFVRFVVRRLSVRVWPIHIYYVVEHAHPWRFSKGARDGDETWAGVLARAR
jgi:hypothetical protein